MKLFTKLFAVLILFSLQTVKAQTNHFHSGDEPIDEFNLPLEYDADSLIGFNEVAAWQQARMSTDQLWRQKRLVAVSKRDFIDHKYGFVATVVPPSVQAPCTNPDFETGTIAGWTASQSPNNNSVTMLPWANNTTANVVTVTPGNDPNIGAALQRVPPGGGNFSCRLGQTGSGAGGKSYRITQTFNVTAANSAFVYRYAVVLNRSSPHSCSEQPFFNVNFKDCNGAPIQCGQYGVTVTSSACSSGGDPSFVSFNSTWAYKPWSTAAFDLTPYIGQCVSLEFTVGGCHTSQAAHGGYAYVDASCQPFTLNLNGTDIPVGQTNSSICGAATTNTLCAPPGFTYNWTGPGVTGQTGQCISTSTTGNYSVTLGIAGTSCPFSPILYSSFNSAPNPTVTASLTQPVCALPVGSATMNVTGGTGPYNYAWTPSAPSNSVNANLPAGTSYTVEVEDDNGCKGTTSFSVDPYPPAPQYTLSTVPGLVLSCTSPSTTISYASTNANTTTSWEGPSGVITGTSVVVTTPGSYTYTAINTVSTCSFVGTVDITGTINMPVATASITQPVCALPVGSATMNVTGGTGPFTYSWTPAAPSTSVNANLPAGTSYTVLVTDDLGCKSIASFSVDPYPPAPQYTLATNPGLVLTCLSPSTTITFAPTNANTSTSWEGPSGAITGTTAVVTAPGTYTYTAINTVSTCSFVGTVNITSNANFPVLTTAVDQPTCATPFGTATVTATNGLSPYTYNWLPAVASPTDAVNTNLPPGTSYTIEVTDDAGCVVSTTLSVNPFAGLPSYTLTSNPGLVLSCPSPSTTLTYVPTHTNTSVSWTGPSGVITGSTTVATVAGTYSYIATNTISTCSETGTIAVTGDTNLPVATYTTSCNTNTISFNASSAPGINLGWALPTTPTTSVANPGTSTAMGTYTLVAVNPVNSCVQTYTMSFSVPSVNIGLSPNTNVITCATPTIQATTTPTSSSNVVVSWTDGVTTSTTNPFPISTGGTYTTTVQEVGGCASRSVVTISTNTVANVSITGPVIIPCSTNTINLTASSSAGGPYTYVWMPSSPTVTTTVLNVANAGTYSVVALNTANGCTTTATQVVTEETIDASFIADPYSGTAPLVVTFTNTSTNATDYSWNLGNSSTTYTTTNAATVYTEMGDYTVILTATKGFCVDTAMAIIRVDVISSITIPNVFTPNGDGKNDVFHLNARNMGEININIFDRWGLKMFETTATGNASWDGKNKSGNVVTDGTYFYIIKAKGLDDKEYNYQGSVNVFQ